MTTIEQEIELEKLKITRAQTELETAKLNAYTATVATQTREQMELPVIEMTPFDVKKAQMIKDRNDANIQFGDNVKLLNS